MQIFNTVQQWVNLKTGEAADPILVPWDYINYNKKKYAYMRIMVTCC